MLSCHTRPLVNHFPPTHVDCNLDMACQIGRDIYWTLWDGRTYSGVCFNDQWMIYTIYSSNNSKYIRSYSQR